MNVVSAILFGIIQGFSECLPVSSSAHLSILGNLFGLTSSEANYRMFCTFLHFGSILAIIVYYLQDIWDIIYQFGEMRRGGRKVYPALRLMLMLLVSSVPLFFLIPLSKYIDTLYYSSIFIGVSLIISGTILFIGDFFTNLNKSEKQTTITDALVIGLCQLVGSIPGISRIGIVLTASMATGHKKDFSVKYAYLLSLPTLFGINILHLVDSSSYGFSWSYFLAYIVGMIVSFGFSYLGIKILNYIAAKGSFKSFGYYSWVAGVLFIILTMIF